MFEITPGFLILLWMLIAPPLFFWLSLRYIDYKKERRRREFNEKMAKLESASKRFGDAVDKYSESKRSSR